MVEILKPQIVVPMRKTPHLSFEIAPVEGFIQKYEQVVKKPYLELEARLRWESPGYSA